MLSGTVNQTAARESYAFIEDLEPDVSFFQYQSVINRNVGSVGSHKVIDDPIHRLGRDYRWELEPNPIATFRDATADNVDVGRVP